MSAALAVPAPRPDIDAALAGLFASQGAVPVEAPILQPAEPFLDAAGDSLRRRIFLTRGERGETLCLRPEWTIPVCLRHIAGGETLPRRYGYRGFVFRQRTGEPAEFEQAGIEDLGDPDIAVADARALAGGLDGLSRLRLDVGRLDIVVGDQNLFEALLGTLRLAPGWRRRLTRSFGDAARLASALASLETGTGRAPPADLLGLAEGGDLTVLEREIARRMEAAGLPPFSGRPPAEVARRLAEKAALARAVPSPQSLAILRDFLALDCLLGEAPARLSQKTEAAGLDLGTALALFAARNRALAAAGVDLSAIRYRAGFGRALDYYTGIVFEARRPGHDAPLAGGGRYDRLLTLLGAKAPIPAVGFALWLDRIAAEAAP